MHHPARGLRFRLLDRRAADRGKPSERVARTPLRGRAVPVRGHGSLDALGHTSQSVPPHAWARPAVGASHGRGNRVAVKRAIPPLVG